MTTDMTLPFERKIVGLGDLHARIATLARPLIFTNGVFDILHRGHATVLAQARALGASLVVGVNSDASVRRLGKGSDRPINGEGDRAAMIAALASVDLVAVFDQDTPYELIEAIRADVIVKAQAASSNVPSITTAPTTRLHAYCLGGCAYAQQTSIIKTSSKPSIP